MSLTPELTLGQPKPGKRKPGLRLTSMHLQPASSTPSPNSSSSYLGTSQSNTTRFREQIGNIVNGAENYNTTSKPMEEEETSLAASYLQSQDVKNQDIPVLREPPLPPATQPQGFDSSTTTHHFMDITPEDLSTISRLGEGAAGTVRKVLHTPTQLVMAKKVICNYVI
jgi:mitogen-activated protein kinase kinase